jgi:hypothetical protein
MKYFIVFIFVSFFKSGYNSQIRPNTLVNITMKLSIKQIVSLDQATNIMTTNVYLLAYWYDLRYI